MFRGRNVTQTPLVGRPNSAKMRGLPCPFNQHFTGCAKCWRNKKFDFSQSVLVTIDGRYAGGKTKDLNRLKMESWVRLFTLYIVNYRNINGAISKLTMKFNRLYDP